MLYNKPSLYIHRHSSSFDAKVLRHVNYLWACPCVLHARRLPESMKKLTNGLAQASLSEIPIYSSL